MLLWILLKQHGKGCGFGMAPLLQDDFWVSMAVTIMFGLAFGTVLTMVVVPVLYAMFYKIQVE